MTKEEIRQAAQDWDGSGVATQAEEGAFIKGAEWMQERMIENPDGGALLYAVVKTAERTKKEMIEKAADWFQNYLFDVGYPDDWLRDSRILVSGRDRFIKAMQDESRRLD